MNKTIVTLALLLAASPAFAQGATQSPPSPNASSSAPTPAGSVPNGAMTMAPGTTANPNMSAPLGSVTTSPPQGPSSGMSSTVPAPVAR